MEYRIRCICCKWPINFLQWAELVDNKSYNSNHKSKLDCVLKEYTTINANICNNCIDNNPDDIVDVYCANCYTHFARWCCIKEGAKGCNTQLVKGNLYPWYGSKYDYTPCKILKPLPEIIKENDYVCDKCLDKFITDGICQFILN